MKSLLTLLFALVILSSCSQKNADLIVYNAKIYMVNDSFHTVEAMVIKDGKIMELGNSEEINKNYKASENLDAKGQSIYPGFIDAHAHFFGYGEDLQFVDLKETQSWEEIVSKLEEFAKSNPEGWIIGRGWDQNDWKDQNFPRNEKINQLFPNRPVYLVRIDGHAAIANQKALELAGITEKQEIIGGSMLTLNGKLTGVLIDNAMNLVSAKIPAPSDTQIEKILLDAQKNCFAVGLTTIDDCGLDYEMLSHISKLQEEKKLKMRLYVMLSDAQKNYDYIFKNGPIKTDRLNVRSFKVYADGALGSRGASLLESYSDEPNNKGFLLSKPSHFEEIAKVINEKNFQMCTHAIGDSANRTILNIYNNVLKGENDKRWRIEHAQIVNEKDFDLFKKSNIIPSVQPTHATSDMYWAEQRLGKQRLKGGYAYKQLLDQNGWMPLGSDFPVEEINPLLTFFAAIARVDAKGYPQGGFQIENALTRVEALKGMTIWAAKANFEENEKGSLEVGKFADFVMLDTDIITTNTENILKTKVLKTYLNGEKVYEAK